jgi:adenosylcobinamide kinase / adenosylcobinamide-phosphate guanylyltransferase
VTSAVSVPAAAGIPVTHRGVSQGFCVLAGHVRPGDSRSSVDWGALARSGMTLVLLMAIDHLAEIADTLISAGLAGGTPGAVVSDGWSRRQRVVTAPLRDLASTVAAAGVTNPAVVVIGDVAQLATGGLLVPGLPPSPGLPSPGLHPSPGDPQPSLVPPSPGDTASSGGTGTPPSPASSARPAARAGRRVLVLGGARSGKSAAAEGMLPGDGPVDYVATGTPPGGGDVEWDARVAGHRQRRPPHWRTVETLALAEVLAAPGPAPVLVDCLTTWLARVMDDCGAWDETGGTAAALEARTGQVLQAWRDTRREVIAVSNEIGSGVVPGTASGRRFRDELGLLNARIAADSDEVWLCTAGIARRLR